MNTSKNRNSIEAGLLLLENVDYHSMISPVAVVDIHLLSCEYGINELLRVILNGMQDLKAFPWLTPERTDILWGSPAKPYNHIKNQETAIFTAGQVSAVIVRWRLEQRGLSNRQPLHRFPLTIEKTPNDKTGCWNVTMSSFQNSPVCAYSILEARGDRTSPTCTPYRRRNPAHGVMLCEAVGYTMRTFLARIDANLNVNRYISDILQSVLVPYLRSLTNAIFQQDNARPWVARRALTFLDIQGIRLLPLLDGLQICPLLKTSCNGLLSDWPSIPLQIVWLMKCGIDLKQDKMSYPFLSSCLSKPSSTPCLIGYGPF